MIIDREGDILKSSQAMICHQVNCFGVMGGGLALQIKNMYPDVYKEYKQLCDTKNSDSFKGRTQFCSVIHNETKLLTAQDRLPITESYSVKYIANMFSQYNYGTEKKHTNYDWLQRCLKEVWRFAYDHRIYQVAIPYKIGCGLAGGDWDFVRYIIDDLFAHGSRIDAIIYKYDGGK